MAIGLPSIPELLDRAARGDRIACWLICHRQPVGSVSDLLNLFWDEVLSANHDRVFEAAAFAFDLHKRKVPAKDALALLKFEDLAESEIAALAAD